MKAEQVPQMAAEESLDLAQFTRGLRVVFSREFAAYFDSPIAYIYTAVFWVLSCTTFMKFINCKT